MSTRLDSGRREFYVGNLERAAAELAEEPLGETDRVLFLMERGMVHHGRKDYAASTKDWLEALALIEKLDYYSVSRGSASMVINDQVQTYRGPPYERMLLHAFTAKNYLAQAMWDDAAVEARRLIREFERLDGYPDDAYCHYLAGFCLELIDDMEGAAFQYRAAAKLLPSVPLDRRTGRIAVTNEAPTAELVCFVGIGRTVAGGQMPGSNSQWGTAPYAEIYVGQRYLGRSYSFANTAGLYHATQARLAAIKTAKTAARVVIKDATARAVAEKNEALGQLVWLLLFAAEKPDTRNWETLPLWLQVARVPCPADLQEIRVVFRGRGGRVVRERPITSPLVRRRNCFVSFCRDVP